ncbi:MAG: protein translocase subunit SecF [bacterium]|nr:protein translocase subunit SecF [bacterium]
MNQMKRFKLVQKRNLWFGFSLIIIAVGFGLMGLRAVSHEPVLNFGIDFTGGTSFIVKFDSLNARLLGKGNEQDTQIAFIEELRGVLSQFGLGKSQIQITQDKAVIIRTVALDNDRRVSVLRSLEERVGVMELLEVDVIGPTIGQELKEQSFWIVLMVSIALLIYITWRFELVFGAAALIAVLHDAMVIISFSSITNLEINTAYVAALLTVLGYSINDTIVIFDRIREQLQAKGIKSPWIH